MFRTRTRHALARRLIMQVGYVSHVNFNGVGQVEKRDKKIADLTRGLEALEMIKNGRQLADAHAEVQGLQVHMCEKTPGYMHT